MLTSILNAALLVKFQATLSYYVQLYCILTDSCERSPQLGVRRENARKITPWFEAVVPA